MSIAWAYLSPQLREGIEDESNLEGVSYIDFFNTKDADEAVTYNATKTAKKKSKMSVLHIVYFNGDFKEKKFHSSPQVYGE